MSMCFHSGKSSNALSFVTSVANTRGRKRVALERYVAVHFPPFPLYMGSTGAVISLKSGVFAVALLDKRQRAWCHDPRKFSGKGGRCYK